MRTTVNLEDDVMAELDRLRRERGLGLSEAANRLIRAGMSRAPSTPATTYVHHTADVGMRVDVSNVGAVLDLLDDAADEQPHSSTGP